MKELTVSVTVLYDEKEICENLIDLIQEALLYIDVIKSWKFNYISDKYIENCSADI